MCGIVGIVSSRPASEELLVGLMDTLSHRGPDGSGTWTGRCGDWSIALGHRRLSIIDLSDAAKQPMTSPDGSCVIVYNGRVYNYLELREELQKEGFSFSTRSDTEVILAAYQHWGPACLEHFNGMWAFALYDAKRNILFCARDHFGIKPFYYRLDTDSFVFASEIKAILAYPGATRGLNRARLADYLAFGLSDHTPETLFEGITQLPPAHFGVFRDGKLLLARYWSPPEAATQPPMDDAGCARGFLDIFRDAIRIRLRSDVPVGTCLSGGLDSSSIVCIANEIMFGRDPPLPRALIGERQKTFSACYENEKYDERPFINAVVEKTGAQPYNVFPEPAGLLDELERLIWHQEEPFVSTSIFAQWCVMRKVRESGVKVLLDGQGGDELLAGYDGYYAALAADKLADFRPFQALDVLRKAVKHRKLSARWLAARTAFFLVPTGVRRTLFPFAKSGLSKVIDPHFMAENFRGWPALTRKGSYVQSWSRQHLLSTSLPALLRYEDRNSMAFSIEARVPFLDHRLVEFVMHLSPEQKISAEWTKPVLRRAMKGIIPEKVRLRRDKKGFETPEGEWFRTEMRPLLMDVIRSRRFAERGFFDARAFEAAFEDFLRGRAGITSRDIWRIINVELWLRAFLDRP